MRKFVWKIERDSLRMIQVNFFPFITQMLEMRLRNHNYATEGEGPHLVDMLIQSVYNDLKRIIERRLIGEGVRFTIKLTLAQSITLYSLLNTVPIEPAQVYMVLLRQSTVNQLYQFINEPQ